MEADTQPLMSKTTMDCSEAQTQPREVFEVALTKGACGFGIYFTASVDGTAIVDPSKPFYRMPDGSLAPGEACGQVAPSDRLLAINTRAVDEWGFQDVVEELRRTPQGDTILRFERTPRGENRSMATADSADTGSRLISSGLEASEQTKTGRWKLFDWQVALKTVIVPGSATRSHVDAMNRSAVMEELLMDMENKIHSLEQVVEREKKCRFLAEKKNILYRNALTSLSDENAQLRHALAQESQDRSFTESFKLGLHLSI